ncbi:MAG TPA: zinc ribbon domain-containing protein [Fimbriimonadales bacterium]|nr:zinc ribbon domain-containing protein [Fimbriimonadales bacterium]
MAEHCYSCAAPLNDPNMRGNSDIYCRWCSDEAGNLRSREEVRAGVAHWFSRWQPDLSPEQAQARADHYLRSMPAWAED